MSENEILGQKDGPIFTVTLNRPKKRNALSFEMLEELCGMVDELTYDPEVRIIIKGEGKVFSAGVDFNSLSALVGRFMGESASGGMSIRTDISKYQYLLTRMEAIEIPIICAMHGAVFGMAWGLVNHIYPADDLYQEADIMAADIIKNAPIAVGALKRITRKGQGMDLNTLLDMEANLQSILLRSEDFQEGITAKMEQRPPNWKRK